MLQNELRVDDDRDSLPPEAPSSLASTRAVTSTIPSTAPDASPRIAVQGGEQLAVSHRHWMAHDRTSAWDAVRSNGAEPIHSGRRACAPCAAARTACGYRSRT